MSLGDYVVKARLIFDNLQLKFAISAHAVNPSVN